MKILVDMNLSPPVGGFPVHGFVVLTNDLDSRKVRVHVLPIIN
jgi:hypothetical protein